jgi:hypothetical protein
MKRSFRILPIVTIPLIFTSMAAFAGDFRAPATEYAAQRAELLSNAAHALENVVASQPRQREGQMSNLWVFPTRDADTVFARYTLTSAVATSTAPSATEHLALVKVRDDGSVNVQELNGDTRSAAHWSASIGNGRTSDSGAPSTATAATAAVTTATAAAATGAPASPHWTSRIGTGRVGEADESGHESAPIEGEQPSKVADAHWTSKVGTGRAAEANDSNAGRTTFSSASPVASGAHSASAF